MEKQTTLNLKHTAQDQASLIPLVSRISAPAYWISLVGCILALVYYQIALPEWEYSDISRINGFTLLIWTTVLFFSAVLSTYSKKYLAGFRYQKNFSLFSFGFTLSVLVFAMSNHVLPLVLSWFAMGFFMANLIGVCQSWGEARESHKFSLKNFLAGSLCFLAGVLILYYDSGQNTLTGLVNYTEYSGMNLLIASLLIIIAAIIQSAIYPFHRWLLSAMTAPTPASALMHAGFVNGSGILLTLFAPLLILSNTLWMLFIIGGITAIVAQFQKLIQVNVKQKLACSTIAQMGFMIMQCGLGFFNAAVAHLILHGFYKAYLFLSSGEQIRQGVPREYPQIKITALQAVVVGLFGIAGAFLFALLTGKTNPSESSIFLTLIVAITVGQAAYNIVKERSINNMEKIFVSVALFLAGITAYAVIFNLITLLMSEMPVFEAPQAIHPLQVVFGIIFLSGFFVMKLGLHRKSPWLYVKLLNLSQPHKTTINYYKKISI